MRKLLFTAALFAVTLVGCAEFEEQAQVIVPENENVSTFAQTRASTATLDNPYSLSSVRQA